MTPEEQNAWRKAVNKNWPSHSYGEGTESFEQCQVRFKQNDPKAIELMHLYAYYRLKG